MCIRSSLNTNKAPLTYCQLSEVNLSRINFRRKRFRLSARKPSRVKLSSYRSPAVRRRWRDECCLYLYFTASHSLSHTHIHTQSLSLSLSLSYKLHTLSLYLTPSRSYFSRTVPIFHLGYMYTRTRAPPPTNLLHGVTTITTHQCHVSEYII